MSATDYCFSLLLVQSVLRQVRGRRLTWWSLTWPVALVAWAATKYVRGFPPTGGDVLLVGACVAGGLALGVGAGSSTRLRRTRGALVARASAITVVLWTAGAVARLVFGLYAENGGAAAVTQFSNAHGIAFGAWADALTLMAFAEVLGRTLVLGPRAHRLAREP